MEILLYIGNDWDKPIKFAQVKSNDDFLPVPGDIIDYDGSTYKIKSRRISYGMFRNGADAAGIVPEMVKLFAELI